MKRFLTLKDYIIIGSLFIVGIIIIPFTQKAGKENIRPIVEETLSQAIDMDYNRRKNKEFHFTTGTGLGRKMKSIKIQTGEGLENIIFEDSLEEERAYQLVNQYMFTKTNPLQPHDLNKIFQEGLMKKGVNGRTGVIYYHEDIAHSSEENLGIISSAIQSDKTFIDVKKSAAVKAWVDCNLLTCLRHSSPIALGMLALYTLLFLLYIIFMAKRAFRLKNQVMEKPTYIIIPTNESTISKHTPDIKETVLLSFTEKGIKIDPKNRQAYIDGKLLQTTPMTFSIFQLLVENMERPVTRQLLEKELWENPEKEEDTAIANRIHQNISKLRKVLKKFPQYEIVGGKGKGYKLILTSTANETAET